MIISREAYLGDCKVSSVDALEGLIRSTKILLAMKLTSLVQRPLERNTASSKKQIHPDPFAKTSLFKALMKIS